MSQALTVGTTYLYFWGQSHVTGFDCTYNLSIFLGTIMGHRHTTPDHQVSTPVALALLVNRGWDPHNGTKLGNVGSGACADRQGRHC